MARPIPQMARPIPGRVAAMIGNVDLLFITRDKSRDDIARQAMKEGGIPQSRYFGSAETGNL